jgi:aspartyl-tRNA(Asn)/glutamyl-tRNA(Gln) amidotransferase subunit A
MKDLHWLGASELGKAYAAGSLSPTEVVAALLQHIKTHDPRINAFTQLDEEAAQREAQAAEAEMHAGRLRGPLHGIPVAIKDIIDVAGLMTTCHSRLCLDWQQPRADAVVVRSLRNAGAIILGKLATWEFAVGGPSFDLPFPPARNPWRPEHQPGGSSSGSGAGLAAGFFPLSIGTDTGGSVRHPAAACGVVGLKPTYGLVSRRGVFPLSFTLDHVGPMARSVQDVALLLQCIAAHDPADPSNAVRVRPDYAAEIEGDVRGLRIGYIRHFHTVDMAADPEVVQGLDKAADTFRVLGAEVFDVTLPALEQFSATTRVILQSEAWAIHRHWLQTRPQDYGQITRRRLASGAFISAADYVTAQRSRHRLIAAVDAAFAQCDVLLAANALDPAGPMDQFLTGSPVNIRQARTPFNATGHPAISLMTGLSSAGLPLSMQLVGRAFAEPLLLRVAAAFARETGFHALRPPLQ